ncbi:MAG: hypothetical protein ABSE77_10070 [Acidimicrobiales bacterium]|jgi:hypothetical protein
MARARSRLSGAVAALVLGTALAACSDAHVVASDSQQLYLKVPSSWTVFDEHALAHDGAFGSLFTSTPIFATIAFGTRHARPGDAFTPTGYPWMIVVVRPLNGTEQSQMSFNGLRDVLFNVDTLQTEGANVQSLATPALLVKGSLHGTLVAYEVQGSQASSALAYEQETWVNSATNKVWVLMAGCSPSCFQAQQTVIGRIMQSFLVTDRGNS